MATIDMSAVRQELLAIRDSSNAIKQSLRKVLEQLETDPSTFPELDFVPGSLQSAYPNITLRKVVLESGKHSFRLVVAHWTLNPEDHVDGLYAFPRRRGYPINWKEVEAFLKERD